jgi:hypothetical protein
MWDLYRRLPGFVLGFHGCDEAHGRRVIAGKAQLKPSDNEYDWLGKGIYFWESNPERALQFASDVAAGNTKISRGTIKKPFVVGAVIDLGVCCNLLDSRALAELAAAHALLVESVKTGSADKKMPANKGRDNAARFLDCAVVRFMHATRGAAGLEPYDTVRGAFSEGGDLYEGAGFSAKAHIQIAVCNDDCIKGYFLPRIRPR